MLDRLLACLWWLVFLGGVGAGAAIGVVLALWLALPPLLGLPLIAACWLGGNAAGWRLAARADAALRRRLTKQRKRPRAASPAMVAPSHPGPTHVRGTAWIQSPGLACP
jgi:hypothetical protein